MLEGERKDSGWEQKHSHPFLSWVIATFEVTSAKIAGDVAIVSIDSKFGDVKFDDMFTLVKDTGMPGRLSARFIISNNPLPVIHEDWRTYCGMRLKFPLRRSVIRLGAISRAALLAKLPLWIGNLIPNPQ